jgi:ABC-type uncharacterized transport system ATPase subunit
MVHQDLATCGQGLVRVAGAAPIQVWTEPQAARCGATGQTQALIWELSMADVLSLAVLAALVAVAVLVLRGTERL